MKAPTDNCRGSIPFGSAGRRVFLQAGLAGFASLSLPGITTAATFVFVLAIGDFLTPQMVGGQSGFTFGRIIYSQFGTAFNWPFGAALAVILGVLVIAVIAGSTRFERRT